MSLLLSTHQQQPGTRNHSCTFQELYTTATSSSALSLHSGMGLLFQGTANMSGKTTWDTKSSALTVKIPLKMKKRKTLPGQGRACGWFGWNGMRIWGGHPHSCQPSASYGSESGEKKARKNNLNLPLMLSQGLKGTRYLYNCISKIPTRHMPKHQLVLPQRTGTNCGDTFQPLPFMAKLGLQ